MAVQAVKPVRQMVETQKADQDGSKWGTLLGAVAAGAAIIGTGGAALPAVLAAAGTGASLGGMAGGLFNKEQKVEEKTLAQRKGMAPEGDNASAMARRAAEKSQSEIAALNDAEKSLSLVPPEIAAEYEEPIKRAKALAQKKYGVA